MPTQKESTVSTIRSYFARETRGEGENAKTFYTLKDDAPEWLSDAVYEAHDGVLPNDWVYDLCDTIADAIDNGELIDDDGLHAFADGNVDIYTKARFAWASEFCLTNIFSEAEERAEELLGDRPDTNERLGAIQFCAIERIAGIILHAWEESTDDDQEENDE